MESFSLKTVHPKFAAVRGAAGVHVNRARSKGTTWLKIRFAVGFRLSSDFSVNGGAPSAAVSTSKKLINPSYRLMPSGGLKVRRTIRVVGSVGSSTGRNCVPGMLTELG